MVFVTILVPVPLPDVTSELSLGDDARCTLKFVINRRSFCTRPAEWACRLACCGLVKIVCDEHRDIAAAVAPRVFICTRCHVERPAIASQWRI